MSDTSAEMPHDDSVPARWRSMVDRAMALAQRAETDAEFRASLGVDKKAEFKMFGGAEPTDTRDDRTRVLEACAKQVISKDFDWEVSSVMGGHAILTLKAYKPGNFS